MCDATDLRDCPVLRRRIPLAVDEIRRRGVSDDVDLILVINLQDVDAEGWKGIALDHGRIVESQRQGRVDKRNRNVCRTAKVSAEEESVLSIQETDRQSRQKQNQSERRRMKNKE